MKTKCIALVLLTFLLTQTLSSQSLIQEGGQWIYNLEYFSGVFTGFPDRDGNK